jgi:hypothetical protein
MSLSLLGDMWENKGEIVEGLLSSFTNPTQEVEKGADWDRDVAAHNIPVDVGNIAQDVKTIVTHPKEAYEAATGLLGGAWRTGLEKVMPEGVMDALGKVDEYVGYDSEPDKAMASEVWQGLVATHGGLEELKKYGNEHPVYLAAELSGLGFLARQVTKMVAPAVVKAMEATEMGVSRGLLAVENVAESVESAFPQPLGTQIFAGEIAAIRVGKSAELAKAKQLESEGVDADTIWKETGFGKGQDGKWRFEIDDSQSTLKPLAKVMDRDLAIKGNELIDYPELLKAYPELENIDVYPYKFNLAPSTFGYYADKGGIPEIGLNPVSQKSLAEYSLDDVGKANVKKGKTLHEFQHAVQAIEDHGSGTSVGLEAGKVFVDENLPDIRAKINNINLKLNELDSNSGKDGTKIIPLLNRKTELEKESVKQDEYIREKGYKNYKNTLGELEAFQTQADVALTAEQRANRLPAYLLNKDARVADSALQLGTENKVLEYVGTNEPQKAYLEYVHIDDLIALQGEYGSTYSKEHWTRLKKEIEKEGGLTDPINIQVDRLSRTADVVEGNHRITLAKEMGYEWLPTWVNLQSDFKNIRKNKRSDIIPSIDNEIFHPAYDTEGNRRPEHLPSYGRPSRYLSNIRTLPLANNKTLQGDPLTRRPKPALEKGLLSDTVVPRLKASDFKRNKDGTYVGFNKSINTPQKITKLLKQLEGLAIEGADARMWYENSSRDIMDLVNGDKVEAEKIAQILAITSQGTDVKSNTGFAFKAYAQHKAGMPIEAGRFPKEQAKKIINVLNGIPWEGRKTNSFYGNLMTQIDPSKVIEGQTTQDMWMARAFGLSRDVPGDAQYKIMEEITQNIAAQNNWTPYQAQAAIWVATKARNESMKSEINAHIKKKKWGKNADTILPQHQQKFNKYFQKMVYDSQFDLKQFTDASYSFADGIQDNLGFINLEAVPSTELVNVLPGIHNALPEQKAEFTKAMYSIFLDENGVDLLAKEIGIASPDGFMGFGGWDGDINPNMQVQGLLSGTISGGINPADVQLVELYAAVVGTVFKQDGVSYRRAFNDTKVSAQNGVDLDVGRRLTAEEHQKIYDALIKVFGHTMVQPTSTGTGADIIQYRHKDGKFKIDEKGLGFDMPNKEFQKLVEQAIMEVGLEDDIHIGFYRSDGKLVENNWKEQPNGEGYEGNTTTKSQSLYRQLVDKYSQEAETIRQEFGDKYGWGEVQKSLITKGLLKTTVKKPPTHLLE